ncbi:MAG: ABC transporter permease [Dehalococcoidia bacterium]
MTAQPPERVVRGADLEPSAPRDGLLGSAVHWVRLHPSALIGGGVVLAFLLVAIFADVLAPYGIDEGDLDNRMAAPSAEHLLGTDKVGRDLFSRLIYGTRASMLLAVGAVLVSQTLAAVVGLASGYFGGWFDLIAQRVIDIWIALPGLLFLIFVIGTIGASTPVVLIVLGLLLFAGSSRVIRGVTLSLKAYPFVEAARGTGASHARVIARHLLPNVLPLIVVQATLQLGIAVLIESSLSFLGFGVPPPTPTWGRMLADARGDLTSPGGLNLAVWPGLAITAVVYSFNMLGDTLHDILEFHQRPRS